MRGAAGFRMPVNPNMDGSGVYGSIFYWAFTIAFCGSALLLFLYLWRKGRLDMDQEPAERMLKEEKDDNEF